MKGLRHLLAVFPSLNDFYIQMFDLNEGIGLGASGECARGLFL